jgi:hypothetical protein
MAFDYASMKMTASELVGRFGTDANIVRLASSGDGYDPTLTATNLPCKAVVTYFKRHEIDGSLVQQNDRKILVTGDNEPKPDDRFTVDGLTLTIMSVRSVRPASTTLVWVVQARA